MLLGADIGGLRRFAWAAWGLALFLLPFNHFGGLRLLAVLVLLVSLLLLWARPAEGGRRPLPAALWVALLLALWATATSVFGPYPGDSLKMLVKDLLVQAVLLGAAWQLVRSGADARRALLCAGLGFVAVLLLSLLEIGGTGWRSGFSLATLPRRHDAYWGGFAATAAVYVPLLLGAALFLPLTKARRATLGGITVLAVLLVILYGSRSPLLVIALVLVAGFILARRFLPLAVLLAAVAVSAYFALGFIDQSYLDRYKSLSDPQTYVSNQGLSQRLSVWQGAAEVIAARPWRGYGYGWKKLALAINDGGFGPRWQAEAPDVAQYYLSNASAVYGKVNPHNYVLQVAFEIGLVGLALVAAFWGLVIIACIALLRDRRAEFRAWGGVLFLILLSYHLSNFANSYWVGGVANMAMVCAGIVLALRRLALEKVDIC